MGRPWMAKDKILKKDQESKGLHKLASHEIPENSNGSTGLHRQAAHNEVLTKTQESKEHPRHD